MGLFAFRTEAGALRAVRDLLKAGIEPSILEFLDRQSVACAEAYSDRVLVEGMPGAAILLIELDGAGSEVRRQRAELKEFMAGKAAVSKEARTAAQAEKLWQPGEVVPIPNL